MQSEKLCLQWNDFQDNVTTAFRSLKEDKDFNDVTLACEDGTQVEAHKVILAASSSFFQKLLRRNKHNHPLIYMRGVKSEDLVAIVDFLYNGEANVYQENLDSFLAVAEELQLKGLTGKSDDEKKRDKECPQTSGPKQVFNRVANKETFPETAKSKSVQQASLRRSDGVNEKRIAMTEQNITQDLSELDLKIKSLMEMSQNLAPGGKSRAHTCKVCGKEGSGINIKYHIESHHIEGLSIPCNQCEKVFRSRNTLRKHEDSHHRV